MAEATPEPLSEIGRYTRTRELGRGGMGVVYLARDGISGEEVALKVLRPGASEQQLRRFEREATLAGSLVHPSIIRVHDVGSAPAAPGSTRLVHYIAMDWVRGPTLAASLGVLDRERALAILAGVAAAVGYAHARGVIHRDLKPANILIAPDGAPIVTDFGLARGPEDASLTQEGAMLGTVHYMAPEQVLGRTEATDARSDVWSLGVILHEIIAGARPFGGRTAAAVYRAILDDEPPGPPGVGRDLERIRRTCLAKDPAERYLDAGELANDLLRLARGEPVRARPPSRLRKALRAGRRHPWRVVAVSALVIIALAVAPRVAQERARTAERARAGAELRAHYDRGEWREAVAAGERLLALGGEPASEGGDGRVAGALIEAARLSLAANDAVLESARRREALREVLAPYARRIESTRTLLYTRHLDIRAALAGVEAALLELEPLLLARDRLPEGWLLLGQGWGLVGWRDRAQGPLATALELARAEGAGGDGLAGEAALALGTQRLDDALARALIPAWPVRWRGHHLAWRPDAAQVRTELSRAREPLAWALERLVADDPLEFDRAECALDLARGDLAQARDRARLALARLAPARPLGAEAMDVVLGHADPSNAIAHWSRALEGPPHHLHSPLVRALRGLEHARTGNVDLALADAEAALAIGPHEWTAAYLRAWVTAARGDSARAEPDLARAAADAPSRPEPELARGALALARGAYAEAERRCAEAVRRDDACWVAWLLLGDARTGLGHTAEAEAAYVLARRHAPAEVARALSD